MTVAARFQGSTFQIAVPAQFSKAMSSCMDAMSLQQDGDKARGAFVDAVHTAGIRVLPD
jgi:hypothetical protein